MTIAEQIEAAAHLAPRWEIELAVALGYDISNSVKCILTQHPFTFVDDCVIAREVIVDADGYSLNGDFAYREVRHPIPAGFVRP